VAFVAFRIATVNGDALARTRDHDAHNPGARRVRGQSVEGGRAVVGATEAAGRTTTSALDCATHAAAALT
jgi:hypothetical protein